MRTQHLSPEGIRDIIIDSLDDDKAEDIVSVSLENKSSIADFMIIASGTSSRQLAAMAEHIERQLKSAGAPIRGREGTAQADWILLDAGDVIVHMFKPETRAFYALERMWEAAPENDENVQLHS